MVSASQGIPNYLHETPQIRLRYWRSDWGQADILDARTTDRMIITPDEDFPDLLVVFLRAYVVKTAGSTAFAISSATNLHVTNGQNVNFGGMPTSAITTVGETRRLITPYTNTNGAVGYDAGNAERSLRLVLDGSNDFTDGDDEQRLTVHLWYQTVSQEL